MDAVRFDALTKAWIAETSRRRMLAGLLGGFMGALSLADADDAAAAKSGKCKKKCGQCKFCNKGKCKTKNGKKRCKKGKCKPVERGTPCGDNGTCFCIPAIEGNPFCTGDEAVECNEAECEKSGDCPAGQRCIRCGDTELTACVHECDEA
jgi:hypothetical protein